MSSVMSRVSCTFSECKLCNNGFKGTYLRSYRPNGLKVLRYEAVRPKRWRMLDDRWFTCGTSLVMQVAGKFTDEESRCFLAFARFETSVESSFTLGQILSLEEFIPNTDESGTKTTEWYPGRTYRSDDDALLRFTFNEHLQRPWCYGWASSASAALRNTLHVFKAYLFNLSDENLQVIGMAQSQGFSIIPYKSYVADIRADAASSALIPSPPLPSNLSPPRGFSCRFLPCACDKPMFSSTYIRCNRANGRKQLRCFPHCCPEHTLHCSCGGPIMVGVDVESSYQYHDRLIMYAHGERYDLPELEVGQIFPHEDILSRLHAPGQNDRGDWISGVRLPCAPNSTCVMFNFNENSRHQGWPYNWKGSATKADRNRKHIFKAYVFLHHPANNTLRVLNSIDSTPFTMSSFRRCNTTPTSRTNRYIEVKPTEIADIEQNRGRKKAGPLSRKRDRVDSPPSAIPNDLHSAG